MDEDDVLSTDDIIDDEFIAIIDRDSEYESPDFSGSSDSYGSPSISNDR